MLTRFTAALVAVAVLAGLAAAADAAVAANLLAAVLGPECAAPACASACAPVACQPTITYFHHGCKVCCGCQPPVQTALEVQVPCGCTCTTTVIPVCLPACCTGAPQVTCHWGPCGRGVVRYDYCCGVIVKIIFRRTGDIVVHYIHA